MINTLSNTNNYISNIPEHIDFKHWDEWQLSAVSDHIIASNVKSIHDPREIDKALNRNNKRKWKHSDALVPAWCVTGLDPLTGERTLQGVQVKPDTPRTAENGKPIKYESASEYDAAPLFLDTGIENYWLNIYEDILQKVFITEGAKKAGVGLSIGLATISIPGVTSCRKKGRLHQNLELFAKLGRTFYLCFDNDTIYKPQVNKALIALSRELAAKGCKIMVVVIPEGQAKGMDDYIALHGAEAFRKLVDEALTFEEWKDEASKKLEEEEESFKSRMAQRFHLINSIWGEHLKYNQLKKAIELDGTPLDMNHIKLILALEFDIDVSKDDAFTIIERIAKSHSYSPVCEYLDEIEAKYPDISGDYLDDLAYQFFGATDPLHAIYFKNFLVAAVARARHPGCWMDCALILHGEQGIRKSTFWQTLFGSDWFSDELGNDNAKDEKMIMHQFWGLEWGEFETVYKRKDVEELKRFLAKKTETFRTPYDRLPTDYKRGFVFVGTTNQTEILNDPTGNRRFWIIPVSVPKIPVEKVLMCRDRIWAAANLLYKSGYVYRLTDEQDEKRAELNKDYQVIDPWSDLIEQFIQGKDFVATQSIYNLLDIDPSHQDFNSDKRIAGVMRRLGWNKGRENRVRGVRGWQRRMFSEKNTNRVDQGGSGGSVIPESIDNTSYSIDPPIDPPRKEYIDPPLVFDPQNRSTQVDHNFSANNQGSSVSDPPDPPKNNVSEKSENGSKKEIICPRTSLPLPGSFSQLIDNKTVIFTPIRYQEDNRTRWNITVEGRRKEIAIAARGKDGAIAQLTSHAQKFIADEFPWKPDQGKSAIYGGELVNVVGFKSHGREFQIELPSGRMMYVKAKQLEKPY